MDAVTELLQTPAVSAVAVSPRVHEKQADLLLDALKTALEIPGEHRLFRWGKLPGLFPTRVNDSAAAATKAVRESYLEVVRTENKGKLIVEWVRATPKALVFVHDRDSPKATLRELREVLNATKAGVPAWMEEAKHEVAQLAQTFDQRAQMILEKLDALSMRLETALRRAEATPTATLSTTVNRVVPWAVSALEYLDRRAESVAGPCPLPDLFRALSAAVPDMTLGEFQDGVRRLHDTRALRLVPCEIDEIEFAFVVEKVTVAAVVR